MAALTSLRIVTAGLIGFVAWQKMLWAIPLSLIAPCLIALQSTRLAAAGTAYAYYGAASLPMIAVARVYWPSLGWGALLPWIAAAALLSLPSILCWTPRESRRPWTTAAAIALTVVPPLCIIGWASPLLSAGVLFPNAGWLGILGTLALPSLFISERTRGTAVFTAIVASSVCNFNLKPAPVRRGWEAESTCVRRRQPADDLAEFSIEQRLQDVAISSRRQFLVFPEGAVRRWTAATDEFWAGAITGSGKTVLVGAGMLIAGKRLYRNSMVILSETRRAAIHQRIPVPGGMWNRFDATASR